MSETSAPAQVQADTLDKFLESWKSQAWEDTINLWSDDFKQRLLPFSLGTPLTSRAEAEVVYPTLVKSLTNWKVSPCLCYFTPPPPTLTARLTLRVARDQERGTRCCQRNGCCLCDLAGGHASSGREVDQRVRHLCLAHPGWKEG